jgi:hypothetical protein
MKQHVFYHSSATTNIAPNKYHYSIEKNANELTIANQLSDIHDRYYLCIHASPMTNEYELPSGTYLLQYEAVEVQYLKEYLFTLNPSKYIKKLLFIHTYLLQSVALLVQRSILHSQINFQSIVIRKDGIPLLSQFGNEKITGIKPFELYLWNAMQTNKWNALSLSNIEQCVDQYVQHENKLLNLFGDKIMQTHKQSALNYYTKYINRPFTIMSYQSTWDVFSLNVLFLRIWIGAHKTIKCNNIFVLSNMKLLVQQLDPNPNNRLSSEALAKQLNELAMQMEPEVFHEIIKRLC